MRQIERVRRARSQLVMKHPFYGCLALGLKLEASEHRYRTMAVSPSHLYVNEDWVAELSDDELRGVIVHEVKHLAYSHCFRRGHRDPSEWNVCCDYAINRDLLTEGFTLPSSRLFDPGYDGMSAEQIFAKRYREAAEAQRQEQQQKQAGGGSGQGRQPDGSMTTRSPRTAAAAQPTSPTTPMTNRSRRDPSKVTTGAANPNPLTPTPADVAKSSTHPTRLGKPTSPRRKPRSRLE